MAAEAIEPDANEDLAAVHLSDEIRAVIDRTASPMVFLDSAGNIRYANPAAGRLVGRSAASLNGVDVFSLVHSKDRDRVRRDFRDVLEGVERGDPVEYRIRASDGSWKTITAAASNLLGLSWSSGILISAMDVTAQRKYEKTLHDLALRDDLTGLPNRRALREYLDRTISADGPVRVAFIDIDHFKRVNDSLGHTVGDTVLKACADRIASLVPKGGMTAHFGADTFVAVWLNTTTERSEGLAWEILASLRTSLFVAGHELRLSASVGLAFRDRMSTAESILRDADAALTRAKTARRGGVEVFTDEMRTEAINRLAIETDLRGAIDRGELRVHFQPVVSLRNGRLGGHEALLRWSRPSGAEIPPSTIVGIAEETGLIGVVSDWVLGQSLSVLESGRSPKVSVNLSPRQLLDPGLPMRVERLLATHAVQPHRLAFEITEAVVIDNFELARDSLNWLRRLGCSVGLDDFGIGYSSLGYLRRLPVDFLKLDRQMVEGIDSDGQALQIAGTIVTLARTLSLATIAEGIEHQTQADTLAVAGCDFGQGWLFGHPEPL